MNNIDVLKNDLKNKNFRKVYWLYGNEPYLKRFYSSEIRKAMFENDENIGQNPDYVIFEENNMTVNDFSEQLEMFPIMHNKKLVVLKDVPFNSPIITHILKNPSDLNDETVILIYNSTISYESMQKNDNENETKKTKSGDIKAFREFIQNYGLDVEINELDIQTLNLWIKKQISLRKCEINTESIQYLITCVGNNMDLLMNEMCKLCAYGEKKINNELIDLLVIKNIERKMYELTDAIQNKDTQMVFGLMKLFSEQKINENIIMSTIYSLAVNLLKIKILVEKNVKTDNIIQLLGLRDFVVKRYVQKIKLTPKENLQKIIDNCCRTDLYSKSTTIESDVLITQLLSEMMILL